LEDRSNYEKPNQTTLKTQFPLLRFVEAILVAEKPKQSDPNHLNFHMLLMYQW